MQGNDELLVSLERAAGAAFLVVLLAHGNVTVNRATLCRCVFVVVVQVAFSVRAFGLLPWATIVS
jgi:hypothetical protein